MDGSSRLPPERKGSDESLSPGTERCPSGRSECYSVRIAFSRQKERDSKVFPNHLKFFEVLGGPRVKVPRRCPVTSQQPETQSPPRRDVRPLHRPPQFRSRVLNQNPYTGRTEGFTRDPTVLGSRSLKRSRMDLGCRSECPETQEPGLSQSGRDDQRTHRVRGQTAEVRERYRCPYP